MTENASPVQEKVKSAPVMPEEKFWKHYSPHHEFSLSTVTSVGVHVLVVVLLVLLARWMISAAEARDRQPEIIVSSGIDLAGPGDSAPGKLGDADKPKEETIGSEVKPQGSTLPRAELQNPQPMGPALTLPTLGGDKTIGKLFEDAEKERAALDEVRNDIAKVWEQMQGQGAPKAQPGGQPGGLSSERREQIKERLGRWSLIFATEDGQDYLRQLRYFGAILVTRDEKNPDAFRSCDASRPLKWESVDLSKIDRIFWVDREPDSVRRLAPALGLRQAPSWIAAFFPHEFEKKLLAIEAKEGKSESQIKHTYFRVFRTGPGSYEVRVERQELR